MMANRILVLIFLFALASNLQAVDRKLSPRYKECIQRGYRVQGDTCVMPDGSRCQLDDFNEGKCGEEFMVDDYCIEQDQFVWDEERCCDGLEAVSPDGIEGQATCQPAISSTSKTIMLLFALVFIVGIPILMMRVLKNR